MSGIEHVDPRDKRAVLEFVRGIENDSISSRVHLELERDISIGELVRALTASGFAITTLGGGTHLIHRIPKEAA